MAVIRLDGSSVLQEAMQLSTLPPAPTLRLPVDACYTAE